MACACLTRLRANTKAHARVVLFLSPPARGERARRARAPDGEPELGRRPASVAYMRIAPARAFYRPVVSMASRQACSLSSPERETSGTRGYCTVPGHRAMCA